MGIEEGEEGNRGRGARTGLLKAWRCVDFLWLPL
jgi:hypothetical protein